jgi:predicted Rossmann fold nucleotide-binding protein DprA/Smf involved in DNA uptake
LEKSIVIVGSRDASEVALRFTDNIAKAEAKKWECSI